MIEMYIVVVGGGIADGSDGGGGGEALQVCQYVGWLDSQMGGFGLWRDRSAIKAILASLKEFFYGLLCQSENISTI